MTDFRMRVAGLDVAVRSIHDRIRIQCADYLIASRGFDADAREADLAVATTQSDIDHERTIGEPGDWRDDYLETLAVFRRIAEYGPMHDRLVFHGATIEVDGRAYIFTAPSGTGKSTHIRLWRRVFGDRVAIINGDKPILRIERDSSGGAPRVVAYGTPWAGKEGWQRNVSAPLGGICVVERAVPADASALRDSAAHAYPATASRVAESILLHDAARDPIPEIATPNGPAFLDDDGVPNTCVRLTVDEALPVVLRQTYMPADPLAAAATLGLLDTLLRTVPIHRLTCTISQAAVQASSTALLP
ncbi:hypothetical protein JS528_07430 [Bifidobacterium sp. MA2]|uniref:Uncharacterized protein n=1 Tax=Bifidobacterium santillanense TaxID=2809028 RepID=A0ABS5UQH1_9BIFI|nr:hypothetical protein [Bifidobacterium santillanense]MBT1173184.1 hypothetical protein [Bifidobacterium santillanense]